MEQRKFEVAENGKYSSKNVLFHHWLFRESFIFAANEYRSQISVFCLLNIGTETTYQSSPTLQVSYNKSLFLRINNQNSATEVYESKLRVKA